MSYRGAVKVPQTRLRNHLAAGCIWEVENDLALPTTKWHPIHAGRRECFAPLCRANQGT